MFSPCGLYLIPIPQKKAKSFCGIWQETQGYLQSIPELLLVVKLSQHPLQNGGFTERRKKVGMMKLES